MEENYTCGKYVLPLPGRIDGSGRWLCGCSTHVVSSSKQCLQLCKQQCKRSTPLRLLGRVLTRRHRQRRLTECQKRRAFTLMRLLLHQHIPAARAIENGPRAAAQAAGPEQVLNSLTTATQVRMQTLARLERSCSSSGGQEAKITRRLESASKSLKNPDTWDGLDFASFTNWKHSFFNWICFADHRLGDQLMMIEQLKSEHLDMSGATAADSELSGKLYSILPSYLRGSALQFARNFVKERCGFRLWQSLLWEFQPSTNFEGTKPMVEQI